MYSGRLSGGDVLPEWITKTNQFLEVAFARHTGHGGVWCPCTSCGNNKEKTKDEMGWHLLKNGFMPNYHRWVAHGEFEPQRARESVVRQRTDSPEYVTHVEFMLDDLENAAALENPAVGEEGLGEEDEEQMTSKFYETLNGAQRPLHGHTEVTQLDGMARLLAVKAQFGWTRSSFDTLLTVVRTLLPKDNILPKNMYESNKIFSELKLPYERIHVCPNKCILFRKEHANDNYCPKCQSSRYIEVDGDDGHKRQLKIPHKVLRYLDPIRRIQRLFMSAESAQNMKWAAEGTRYRPGVVIHPSDAEAWKDFVKRYPNKAGKQDSVAIAITLDGFNPFGMTNATYSCWPVFVIPMNLPLASA